MKTAKQVLNISQHSQENTFTGVSFLINIVAACNLSLCLFKKRFQHWCFPDSYLNFLTTTFLKREKKHCYKKKSIVIRNVDHMPIANLNFYVTSPRFLYFSTAHSNGRLYIVLSVKKKSLKVVNNTPTIGLQQSLTCQHSHADISPLILMTDLINIYPLLPENVSFLERF